MHYLRSSLQNQGQKTHFWVCQIKMCIFVTEKVSENRFGFPRQYFTRSPDFYDLPCDLETKTMIFRLLHLICCSTLIFTSKKHNTGHPDQRSSKSRVNICIWDEFQATTMLYIVVCKFWHFFLHLNLLDFPLTSCLKKERMKE